MVRVAALRKSVDLHADYWAPPKQPLRLFNRRCISSFEFSPAVHVGEYRKMGSAETFLATSTYQLKIEPSE